MASMGRQWFKKIKFIEYEFEDKAAEREITPERSEAFASASACNGPYSKEPLASAEWVAKYKKEKLEGEQRERALQKRLRRIKDVDKWLVFVLNFN